MFYFPFFSVFSSSYAVYSATGVISDDKNTQSDGSSRRHLVGPLRCSSATATLWTAHWLMIVFCSFIMENLCQNTTVMQYFVVGCNIPNCSGFTGYFFIFCFFLLFVFYCSYTLSILNKWIAVRMCGNVRVQINIIRCKWT